MAETLSFVIPVFNEETGIGEVVSDLHRDVLTRLPSSELIVVNDGSTDATAGVLGALATEFPQVRVLDVPRNLGQGPATRLGYEAARGDWLCHLDGDGQLVAGEFWRLWNARDAGDLVVGTRTNRRDPVSRLVIARCLRALLIPLAGRRLEDAASPFRLMRRSTWQDVQSFAGERAQLFSILVSVAAARRGWRVVETPITHLPRRYGRSRLTGLRLLRLELRGCAELAVLCARLRGADRAQLVDRRPARGEHPASKLPELVEAARGVGRALERSDDDVTDAVAR